MLATPELTFSQADVDALDNYLVDYCDSTLSCEAAEISKKRFFEDLLPAIQPYLRGSRVGYSRFANGKNIVDADPVRLDYEIGLAQLNAQQRMCITAYRRTESYGKHLHQRAKTQSDMPILPQKAITGDIRFLQLARSLRHEMDVIESKLNERIEQLAAYRDSPHRDGAQSHPNPTRQRGMHNAEPPTSSPQSPPSPPQVQPAPAAQKPTNQAQNAVARPAEVKAPLAAQILKPTSTPSPILHRDDLLTALGAAKIPEIQSPPRKQDKYAGVNR